MARSQKVTSLLVFKIGSVNRIRSRVGGGGGGGRWGLGWIESFQKIIYEG